jgi:hypothetical protein
MKKIIALATMVLVAVGIGLAQDYKPTSEYGFSMATNMYGQSIWTNNNAYPFKINSMTFGLDTSATTNSVSLRHDYKTPEYIGNEVVTSLWDAVTTNFNYTITNTLVCSVTNSLLVATNAMSEVYGTDRIKQVYILHGDVLTWTYNGQATNTANVLIWNTTR